MTKNYLLKIFLSRLKQKLVKFIFQNILKFMYKNFKLFIITLFSITCGVYKNQC